jgi:hypothetical protein
MKSENLIKICRVQKKAAKLFKIQIGLMLSLGVGMIVTTGGSGTVHLSGGKGIAFLILVAAVLLYSLFTAGFTIYAYIKRLSLKCPSCEKNFFLLTPNANSLKNFNSSDQKSYCESCSAEIHLRNYSDTAA